MGIPADYNDKDYAGTIPSTPPLSSMLPVPKAMKASQECVGGSPEPVADRLVGLTMTGVEGRPGPTVTGEEGPRTRAPIKMVDGRPWSPGVYRALRMLGHPLEAAWERAFIRTSHF